LPGGVGPHPPGRGGAEVDRGEDGRPLPRGGDGLPATGPRLRGDPRGQGESGAALDEPEPARRPPLPVGPVARIGTLVAGSVARGGPAETGQGVRPAALFLLGPPPARGSGRTCVSAWSSC